RVLMPRDAQGRWTSSDGRIQALAYLNVVGLADLALTMTDESISREIVETMRNLAEVALRPGAWEEAQADGLIEITGNDARLVEPSPTPWQGPAPTPAPAAPEAPAAPDPGMAPAPGMDASAPGM